MTDGVGLAVIHLTKYIGNIHFPRLWDPSGILKPNQARASVGVFGLAGVAGWLSNEHFKTLLT